MNADLQEYRERIKSVGLKATPQRISVLKVLSETDEHPSAEMLMDKLKNEGSIMSVGTIYNILETFEEKGLILSCTIITKLCVLMRARVFMFISLTRRPIRLKIILTMTWKCC